MEDRAGPKDRSYREGGFNSIKETFLTELLNNEWTAREVESLKCSRWKDNLGEGTPAFVKRLDWMNLRSLSILRF